MTFYDLLPPTAGTLLQEGAPPPVPLEKHCTGPKKLAIDDVGPVDSRLIAPDLEEEVSKLRSLRLVRRHGCECGKREMFILAMFSLPVSVDFILQLLWFGANSTPENSRERFHDALLVLNEEDIPEFLDKRSKISHPTAVTVAQRLVHQSVEWCLFREESGKCLLPPFFICFPLEVFLSVKRETIRSRSGEKNLIQTGVFHVK